jgi:hypothetical protein
MGGLGGNEIETRPGGEAGTRDVSREAGCTFNEMPGRNEG